MFDDEPSTDSELFSAALTSSSPSTGSGPTADDTTQATSSTSPAIVHFASWNLRYDSQPDGLSIADSIARLPDPLAPPSHGKWSGSGYYANTGERPWSERRIAVGNVLRASGAEVIGECKDYYREARGLDLPTTVMFLV